MNRRTRHLAAPARRQQGATLVVVLILLLVMTLLGLASLRSTVLEERMTSNLLDRSLGFQVAEAGLREAEATLDPNPNFTGIATGTCNSAGLCARPDPNAMERWLDPNFNDWRTASVFDANTAAPEYIIEDMGEGPNWRDCDRLSPIHPLCLTPRYRVTVRSQQDGRASVTLQTIFAGK
jgi:type IV pilus assembly protein PilX